MRTLDDFRNALATETAGLRIDLSTDRIRRRARRVRARRAALVAAGLVLALAIPAGVLAAGPDRRDQDTARPGPVCVTPPGADGRVPWIGDPVKVFDGSRFNNADEHAMLVGVTGTVDRPTLTVVFHHTETGVDEYAHETALRRTPGGGFTAADQADAGRRLLSVRMNYGNVFVVDVGLYGGRADSVTITANGVTVDASTVYDERAGWTLFWARHDESGAGTPVLAAYADGTRLESAAGAPGPGPPVKPSASARQRPAPSPSC